MNTIKLINYKHIIFILLFIFSCKFDIKPNHKSNIESIKKSKIDIENEIKIEDFDLEETKDIDFLEDIKELDEEEGIEKKYYYEDEIMNPEMILTTDDKEIIIDNKKKKEIKTKFEKKKPIITFWKFKFSKPNYRISNTNYRIKKRRELISKKLSIKNKIIKIGDKKYLTLGLLSNGEGGNGIVYIIKDIIDSKIYIIKIMKLKFIDNNKLINKTDKMKIKTDEMKIKREVIIHDKLMEIMPEYSVKAQVFVNNGVFILFKKFIKGERLKDSAEKGIFSDKKQIALRKLFDIMAKTKYSFKSINPANIIYEYKTGKWIIIDAGDFEQHPTVKAAYKAIIKKFKKDFNIYKNKVVRFKADNDTEIRLKFGGGKFRIVTKNMPKSYYNVLVKFKKSLDNRPEYS